MTGHTGYLSVEHRLLPFHWFPRQTFSISLFGARFMKLLRDKPFEWVYSEMDAWNQGGVPWTSVKNVTVMRGDTERLWLAYQKLGEEKQPSAIVIE